MVASRVEDSYGRLHPRLWHALVAYTGDTDLAGDVETDAFSQALIRSDGIDDVDAWVWRSAFVAAGDLLAERSDRSSSTPEAGAPAGPGGEDRSTRNFLSQLDQLSNQQRAIVVLRYLGRFRPDEIAELLDTTAATIRVQLHRAHVTLKKAVQSDG